MMLTITITTTTITLLSSIFAIVTCVPFPDDAGSQAITKRDSPGIPANIPGPPVGQCSLLVFSGSILPFGGTPSSVSGEGVGPSDVGDPEVVVINMGKDIVGGPVPLAPQSPGFAASVPLNEDLIVAAQTLYVNADGLIMVGNKEWGITYHYAGVDYNCHGVCLEHSESTGVFGVYNVHQGFFPC